MFREVNERRIINSELLARGVSVRGFEFLRELAWRGIEPRRKNCVTQNLLLGGFQINSGAAAASPRAAFRREDLRRVGDELRLLLGRELHHPSLRAGGPERRENLPAHAKVWMILVRRLRRLWKSKRHPPKLCASNRHAGGRRPMLIRIVRASNLGREGAMGIFRFRSLCAMLGLLVRSAGKSPPGESYWSLAARAAESRGYPPDG